MHVCLIIEDLSVKGTHRSLEGDQWVGREKIKVIKVVARLRLSDPDGSGNDRIVLYPAS